MLKTVGNPSTRFGDQTIVNGNLVIGTAGKGIDFSADPSAPGMTSELFDDYEEGTWTPTLSTSATDFTSVTYDAFTGGRYTKIGNVVHIQCAMRTDAVTIGAASGTVVIKGLPYAAINTGTDRSNYGSCTIGQAYAWGGDTPIEGQIYNGNTRVDLLYRTAVNGASVDLAPSDVATGADANQVYFSATYITG